MGTAHPQINFTNLWNSSLAKGLVMMSASCSSDAIHWIVIIPLFSSMNWLKCQCFTLMCLVLGLSLNSLANSIVPMLSSNTVHRIFPSVKLIVIRAFSTASCIFARRSRQQEGMIRFSRSVSSPLL